MEQKEIAVFVGVSMILIIITTYIFIVHPILEEVGRRGIKSVVEKVWYGAEGRQ